MSIPTPGHVFVINGDVTRISCDAWLLPTDRQFSITGHWAAHTHSMGRVFPEENEWEGRSVIPWITDTTGPEIWLADVDAAESSPDRFGGLLTAFAVDASAHLRGKLGAEHRPRLALNLIGSGAGGQFRNKGKLVKDLLSAAHRAVQQRIDIVLVAWGNKQYAAVQRARLDLCSEPNSIMKMWDFGAHSERLHEEARKLAPRAMDRELVMFVGAGASAAAGMPTWQELLDDLGRAVNLEPTELQRFDVRDQAAIIKQRQSNESFEAALNLQLRSAHYSLVHGLLASLPIDEAVTTNFDTLLETAMRTSERKLAVLPDEPVQPNGRWLLKLHGSLDSVDGITLSRADYLDVVTRYAALFALVQALLLTRHMLFVGYSLKDEDFHQVVHSVQQARGDKAGAFGTTLELFDLPLASELWNNKLTIIPMLNELYSESRKDAAAYQLAVFLDLLAFRASDGRSFLMDDTYSEMLTDDERRLKATLEPLRLLVGTSDGVLNRRILEILEQFGA